MRKIISFLWKIVIREIILLLRELVTMFSDKLYTEILSKNSSYRKAARNLAVAANMISTLTKVTGRNFLNVTLTVVINVIFLNWILEYLSNLSSRDLKGFVMKNPFKMITNIETS